jgi:hypothetical protein
MPGILYTGVGEVWPAAQIDEVTQSVQRDAGVARQPLQEPLFQRTVRKDRHGNGAVHFQAVKRQGRLGTKQKGKKPLN